MATMAMILIRSLPLVAYSCLFVPIRAYSAFWDDSLGMHSDGQLPTDWWSPLRRPALHFPSVPVL